MLRAAIGISEEASPQTLHTQVVNYNAPPKRYNAKDLYLQYMTDCRLGTRALLNHSLSPLPNEHFAVTVVLSEERESMWTKLNAKVKVLSIEHQGSPNYSIGRTQMPIFKAVFPFS